MMNIISFSDKEVARKRYSIIFTMDAVSASTMRLPMNYF